MLIRCTKKHLDGLRVTPKSAEDEDPLFSWHAMITAKEMYHVDMLFTAE